MDAIMEIACDRGVIRHHRRTCGMQRSSGAPLSHPIQVSREQAVAPLPGSDSAVYSKQCRARTAGHMAWAVVGIRYKSETDSCKVSHQHL